MSFDCLFFYTQRDYLSKGQCSAIFFMDFYRQFIFESYTFCAHNEEEKKKFLFILCYITHRLVYLVQFSMQKDMMFSFYYFDTLKFTHFTAANPLCVCLFPTT